jgi:hypothetical protein
MFNWRNAIGLTVIFGIVGIIYWFGWYNFFPPGTDYTGFVLLLMLGVAMGFGFIVLLRSSREL